MKSKKINPLSPAKVGLSIIVCSGPRGIVRDGDWPCIEYTIQVQDARRNPLYTGEYRLGVGLVRWPKSFEAYPKGITQDERSCLNAIRINPGAQIKDKQLWANTAAKLAAMQKVTPTLNSVCESLLLDGSAFFDGGTFESWAADIGYDSDSIKAKEIFEACDKIGRAFARALSRDELDSLREWASTQ